jgi:hypothetical protein
MAFLLIARHPVRGRPMMVGKRPEKILLPLRDHRAESRRGRLDAGTDSVSLAGWVFLVLFAISYRRTNDVPGK